MVEWSRRWEREVKGLFSERMLWKEVASDTAIQQWTLSLENSMLELLLKYEAK